MVDLAENLEGTAVAMSKPAQNEPCPCGSGKKYKRCHAATLHPFPIAGAPGWWIGEPTVEARAVEVTSSPVPEWLLRLAQDWVASSEAPGAGEAHALHALLFTVTAGEALLNRLLEPLVDAATWSKLEMKGAATKWVKLSLELKLKPQLDRNSGVLGDFMKVVDLRNSLVHFKHGQNQLVTETEVESSWSAGAVSVDLTKRKSRVTVSQPALDVRAELHPTKARAHFEALRRLLDVVLAAHPDDEFKIVERLRAELAKQRQT